MPPNLKPIFGVRVVWPSEHFSYHIAPAAEIDEVKALASGRDFSGSAFETASRMILREAMIPVGHDFYLMTRQQAALLRSWFTNAGQQEVWDLDQKVMGESEEAKG